MYKNNVDWYNDLQEREGKVVDNIQKSVGNEADGKLKEDSGVQIEHKGLAELSEDELISLLSKIRTSIDSLTDGNSLKIANQHLNLIVTELKKRKVDDN